MPTPRLTTRAFLDQVRDHLLAGWDRALPRPTSRILFSSLQFHFGDPRLHYEVWPVRKTGRIEIGLHLEGPADWSRALTQRLALRADEIRHALGSNYELEEWTAAWCRLHATLPFDHLTPDLARLVADHLLRLMRTLHPLLLSLDLTGLPALPGRGEPVLSLSKGRRRPRPRSPVGRPA